MDVENLSDAITATRMRAGRPIVVGISGFGGSGKSTLARALVGRQEGAVRMRGDDFLDPVRSHRRSRDWDGVDRDRLVAEVLLPFREGRPSVFRRYDWHARALAAPEPVPRGEVLIVDLVGLLHPAALGALDLAVWCDVDLRVAGERGIARDRALGHDHDRLWNEVWIPNDRDFAEDYRPREIADIRFTPPPPATLHDPEPSADGQD